MVRLPVLLRDGGNDTDTYIATSTKSCQPEDTKEKWPGAIQAPRLISRRASARHTHGAQRPYFLSRNNSELVSMYLTDKT